MMKPGQTVNETELGLQSYGHNADGVMAGTEAQMKMEMTPEGMQEMMKKFNDPEFLEKMIKNRPVIKD